jgi:predicted ABC-class ATPase
LRSIEDLHEALRRIDGRGYRAYKTIAGEYDAGRFRLHVDHVQGDPFAEPSRLRASVPAKDASLPGWTRATGLRRVATADFLNRALHASLGTVSSRQGSGRSGELWILRAGQEVLRRACLTVTPEGSIEARFRAGLPARGRTVLGKAAAELIDAAIAAVDGALLFEAIDAGALRRHIETVEDADALRAQLGPRGLVAFVADGAILPRRTGIDDRPLDDAVPFHAPESLRITLTAPNAGDISGLGVRQGVTLIVGGGFHGKSTLLRAIERGVYDHIPGDGRECVVTVSQAVKVRAEDGRSVAGVDISNFIGPLPRSGDTRAFTTSNASGSTSQAAAIVEALEVGATCLLLDEDTSATNFMIRDARMQALIGSEREPITPFIDRARELAERLRVSTVLVVGGSGDYFDVADTVIAMDAYSPSEVTAEARAVATSHPTRRVHEGGEWRPIAGRVPLPDSLDPSRGRREVHVRAHSEERLLFGTDEVDLSAVEQIVDRAQTRAMGLALAWARATAIDGQRSLAAALAAIMDALEADGLDAFQREKTGELAEFRIFELAAFLGRVRTLRVRS